MKRYIPIGLALLLGGCSTNLASAIDSGTRLQVETQDFFISDMQHWRWVQDRCFAVQESRVQALESDGEYDRALAYLREMYEKPLPADFISDLRKDPEAVLADPRWCGSGNVPGA